MQLLQRLRIISERIHAPVEYYSIQSPHLLIYFTQISVNPFIFISLYMSLTDLEGQDSCCTSFSNLLSEKVETPIIPGTTHKALHVGTRHKAQGSKAKFLLSTWVDSDW